MSALSCAGASADAIADGVGHGAFASSIAGSEYERPCKRKRRPAGTPDPGAEVVALSPKTLMESDRYVCEICNQGFQRDQNLQMHRRRHKVPWKLLKKPNSIVTNRRVYICPERSCLHHDPAHALGDLVGIKKHFRRKHCTEKQWKCVKCSKRYAVQSDYKAHLKTCGTRGHCCDCGRVFSRVESFIEHQDTCSAVTRKAGTQSNSSLLRHIADKILSIESSGTTQAVSFAHMSDTADVISTKPTDEPRHPSESPALKREVAMPFWLIARECRSNLELSPSTGTAHFVDLNSVPRGRRLDRTGSIGQLLPISLHGEESVHSPCLRLSIGPAASSAETASSCPSPHPSCRVDHRNPRSRSVDRETRVSSSHFVGVSTRSLESTSHSAAIGKDLALSIPDRELPKSTDRRGFSDFLGQATWLESCNAGLCQSLKKHPMYNRSTDAELQPVL